jgi:hypothetical protein
MWAIGMNPRLLMDGEKYTAPWGRVRASVLSEDCEFHGLAWEPAPAGIQGVRPATRDEIRILGDSSVEEDFAHALEQGFLPPGLESSVRSYYRLWRSIHTVARLIEPHHPLFFSWLGK